MDTKIQQIGFYAGLTLLFSTLLFGVCFFSIFFIHPIFTWGSLAEYATYCSTYPQFLKHTAQASMVLLSICVLLIVSCIHEVADPSKKFFSRLSISFATISTTLLSMGYFLQFTTVKWAFEHGQLEGLEHFVQFYPHSAILSIIMLGYTLFLGLSFAFLLPVIRMEAKQKLLKLGLYMNAIACLLGLIGFLFQIIPLILFATNIGNGGAFILMGIGCMKYFTRESS